MGKRLFLLLCLLIAATTVQIQARQKTDDAMDVIRRFSGDGCKNIRLELKNDRNAENDWFRTYVKGGVLHIEGNSNLALCRGFYEFVKDNGWGIYCWNGSRCDLPETFGDCTTKKVVSPFRYHYYMNVCTFGYSTPYWDWERWEKEIDWMALHGINMPLALVANEAISLRVWKRLGLTEEEINDYFTGPAHLPWMRMGNISHHDGPLTSAWHEQQVELQHKILERMRELGMNPICPAFAGFVPKSMTRLYPDLKLAETTWGSRFKNWMVDPKDPLFFEIGKMFIEEWEKEFGKCDFYLADSFNEMEIPFPPVGTEERYEMLRLYGDRLYQSIRAGNKDAVWVMQGWMFGYSRDIWEPKTLEALLENVPDDKIILLDLAANYNRYVWNNECNWDFYKGFFNTTWIYSVIPNMGGKSTVSGCLDFFANNHLVPLNSPNRGQLCGHGLAPEGIESNEMAFELITDAGWRNYETDVTEWLDNYTRCRYGISDTTTARIWNEMRKSVYANYVSHPRFNWMYRPGSIRNGSVNVNSHLYTAVQTMLEWGKDKPQNILMKSDIIEWSVLYAGQKMELLVNKVQDALYEGDREGAEYYFGLFRELGLKADRLMLSHPNHRAEKWVEYARNAGTTEAEKDHYEMNAKRIITVWGPPVDDYSSRGWSGVLRDYYIPRWEQWFAMRLKGIYPDLTDWELNWVENSRGFSEAVPYEDVWEGAEDVVRLAKSVPEDIAEGARDVLGEWYFKTDKMILRHLNYNIDPEDLMETRGIRFVYVEGSAPLIVEEVQIRKDGKVIESVKIDKERQKGILEVPFNVDTSGFGNNGCAIKVIAYVQGESAGRAMMIR